jgi:hypothetical protein
MRLIKFGAVFRLSRFCPFVRFNRPQWPFGRACDDPAGGLELTKQIAGQHSGAQRRSNADRHGDGVQAAVSPSGARIASRLAEGDLNTVANSRGAYQMAGQVKKPVKPPVGDPPEPKQPVKAEKPMEDPFTEQVTHPAVEGQGDNTVQPEKGAPGENDEDAWPVEEGFGLIP